MLGEDIAEPTFPDTLCGFRRDREFGRPVPGSTNADPFDEDDIPDGGAYELGADPVRDETNAELWHAWRKFHGEAKERKWSQLTRNRHTAEFAAHLRRCVGRSMVDPGYDALRKSTEDR
jgi:hypothetical protein